MPVRPVSPPSSGNASADQVVIDWTSIRKLARLFDQTGDAIALESAVAMDLASTRGLVGDDEDGVAFAEWYGEGFHALTSAINDMAEVSFSVAGGLRDFRKLWDMLEENIITSLPSIAELSSPPIPESPPAKTGA
ncbi:hypothetical protein OHA77_08890 [Streptosporangium sp. NBC_01639]|uniref:hypothetical protein n=1 Tax=Streptosporangium sp. NBC_01639 TaxID=2975948 RepID=UPI00386467DE|nr:hypothetical protein OHA77_08890 [Streptosporangium sp. NBC_01639]